NNNGIFIAENVKLNTIFAFYKDPCLTGNTVGLYLPQRRDVGCEYKQDHLCDDLMSSTWYRVDSPMLNYCPGKSSCGALYPIWLDDEEPTNEGETIETEVCVVGLNSCCDRTYSIKMKKCDGFVAYCLPRNKTYCEPAKSSTLPSSVGITTSNPTHTEVQHTSTASHESTESSKVQYTTSTETADKDAIRGLKTDNENEETWTTWIAVSIVMIVPLAVFVFFICKRIRSKAKGKKCKTGKKKDEEVIKKVQI
ncbi:hypothetical protein FSP39_004219, partial [Pinctada imbricata]